MAKQHNHLARAPLPPSPYEQKIFTLLLAGLTADMVKFPQAIRISVKEVTGADNPDTTHYELIKKACLDLFARDLNLLPPNAPKGSISRVHIVSAVKHITDEGYIEAQFADKLVPYLLELRERQFHLAGQEPSVLALGSLLKPGEHSSGLNEI